VRERLHRRIKGWSFAGIPQKEYATVSAPSSVEDYDGHKGLFSLLLRFAYLILGSLSKKKSLSGVNNENHQTDKAPKRRYRRCNTAEFLSIGVR
jgi:hypothetical protein